MKSKTLSLLLVFLAASVAWAQETGELARYDGTPVNYYLDTPESSSYPVVVLLQGSECLKVSHKFGYLREAFTKEGCAVLRVEKPGLNAETEIGECPPVYIRLNTPQQRVLDLLQVVNHLRRTKSNWNGKIALVGGSEGSMVANMAALRVPQLEALMLLGCGGGFEFKTEVLWTGHNMLKASGKDEKYIEEALEEMADAIRIAWANPTPFQEILSDEEELARNTNYWWSKTLKYKGLTLLSQLEGVPIMLVHGKNDLNLPFESTLKLYQELMKQEKDVTLHSYEGGHVPSQELLLGLVPWVVDRLRD